MNATSNQTVVDSRPWKRIKTSPHVIGNEMNMGTGNGSIFTSQVPTIAQTRPVRQLEIHGSKKAASILARHVGA